MRPLFGPRTVVEAAFLVAVPVIALAVGVSWPAIIGAGGGAYLIVLAVEAAIWREGKRAAPAPAAEPAEAVAEREHVRVIRAEPELEAVPVAVVEAAPEPELEPVAVESGGTVVSIGRASRAREWNVWDLERVAREHAGDDPIADEERTFLLLYLRDFAGPDGLLPADFDDLVRQSFGGLVANL